MVRTTASTAAAVALSALAGLAHADIVQVRVTVENLAASNGVAISPVTLAAHDGSFDAFNAGSAAGLGTQRVAEAGDGSIFAGEAQNAFPGVVTGVATATTNAFGPGIFLPGGSGSVILSLDSNTHRFLSYGAMVVPSNDFFIGNDSPTSVELFDGSGNFVAQGFTLTGADVWDAGTEVNQLFGAAFVAGQDGAAHADENGVVTLGADFGTFLGSTTPAGYTFSDLPGNGAIVRFSFAVVPAPGSTALLGLGGLVAARRRR